MFSLFQIRCSSINKVCLAIRHCKRQVVLYRASFFWQPNHWYYLSLWQVPLYADVNTFVVSIHFTIRSRITFSSWACKRLNKRQSQNLDLMTLALITNALRLGYILKFTGVCLEWYEVSATLVIAQKMKNLKPHALAYQCTSEACVPIAVEEPKSALLLQRRVRSYCGMLRLRGVDSAVVYETCCVGPSI